MIADVDATVAAWLGSFLPGTTITFGPPSDPEQGTAGRGRAKAELAVFLDDIREDLDAGSPGWTSVRDDSGVLIGRMPPSRTYRLSYLLVACGSDTTVEHQLLGRILAGSVLHDVVGPDLLAGQLREVEGPVLVRCAPSTRGVDPQHLWSAWGVTPRTWLELSVLAPMPPALVHEVAEPPTRIHLEAHRHALGRTREDEDEPTTTGPVSQVTED